MSNAEIQQVETAIAGLEKALELSRSTLEELRKQKAAARAEPEQEPWLKFGAKYYWGSVIGTAHTAVWREDKYDIARLLTNNCHRTEEQAKRHKEYITSPRVRARELVERLDGFDILGEYLINITKAGAVERVVSEYITGGIRFDCPEACDNARKAHYKLITVALGVTVGEEAERIVREYVGRGE